jgi:hypothetical protein
MYGRPSLDTAPVDWDWSNCQVSKEEMAAAWVKAADTNNLWAKLEPLPSFDYDTIMLLRELIYRHDVFFVTNRFETPGASPMKQTKHWFYVNAQIHSPNVLIAKDKGPMASVLQLDAFIDDRPKNCLDVLGARPSARVYLADSSHNKTFVSDWNEARQQPFIPRVADLKEFLKIILEAKMGHWNNRVVKRVWKEGTFEETTYSVHEAFYGLDGGDTPHITMEPEAPSGETIAELREELERMLRALNAPVLDYETRKEI